MPQAREIPDGVVFVFPECDFGFGGVQGVKLGYFEAFVAEFRFEGLGETASPGLAPGPLSVSPAHWLRAGLISSATMHTTFHPSPVLTTATCLVWSERKPPNRHQHRKLFGPSLPHKILALACLFPQSVIPEFNPSHFAHTSTPATEKFLFRGARWMGDSPRRTLAFKLYV